MTDKNVKREETVIIPVITDFPDCYLDTDNKNVFIFKNGCRLEYKGRPENTIPLHRSSTRIWGNSYISGAKGFSEYENGKLVKTGVWVQNAILYYVADNEEVRELYKLCRRGEKTLSPLMEESFGRYEEKKIIRHFTYTSFAADIKNKRLYIRHSDMKDIYWEAIDSPKKFGSFEMVVPYFSVRQLRDTLSFYNLASTEPYLHPFIEEEAKKEYTIDEEMSHAIVNSYITKKTIEYIYSKIKEDKDFCRWEEDKRIQNFILPLTGYIAPPYKEESINQNDAVSVLIPFDNAKLSAENRTLITEKLLASVYKFEAIKFYLTAPGLGKAYQRRDKKTVLYYSSIRGKIKDDTAKKFKCTGKNYEDVIHTFPDYPRTNGTKRKAYNDPYCAVDAWAICRRLGKTNDINDFNAVYSYLQRKKNAYKDPRQDLGLIFSHDIYHEYRAILKNKSLAGVLQREKGFYLNQYLSSLQTWHELKKKIGRENCTTEEGVPFERLSFTRLEIEVKKLATEVNSKNIIFCYKKSEKKQYERVIDGYTFAFEPDFYTIVKDSTEMGTAFSSSGRYDLENRVEKAILMQDAVGNKRLLISFSEGESVDFVSGNYNIPLSAKEIAAFYKWAEEASLVVTSFLREKLGILMSACGKDSHRGEIRINRFGKEYYDPNYWERMPRKLPLI